MEGLINSSRTGPNADSYIKTKPLRFTLLSETLGMNRLTLILVLTMTVLLGSSGVCWSAYWEKGLDAYDRGDYATALKEWTPLAEQGNASAQRNLGVMYAFGKGILKDYVYAHMWANIAAMNGNELGGKLRDDFEKQMTPAQISEAEKLARECVAKNYKGC
jgi:TPR repeat protein